MCSRARHLAAGLLAWVVAAVAMAATPSTPRLPQAAGLPPASLLRLSLAQAPAGVPAGPPNAVCLACHSAGLAGAPKVDATELAHSAHASLSCVSCHTGITKVPHQLRPPPVACARCHVAEGRELSEGMHAAQGMLASATPTCVECHGTHAAAPVTSVAFHRRIATGCARCHASEYRSYMATAHGQAATLGRERAPTCATCHDPHLALPPVNARSRVSKANILATCSGCHRGAAIRLVSFDPHPQPDSIARSPLIAYSHYFMVALLAGVFGFFGLHTLLWLQRGIVARVRGELPPLKHFGGPHIQRFTVVDRLTHVTVIVSFMLLALTGLPLMYPTASWSWALTRFWGGVHAMHINHLVNAAITFGYFFFHLAYLAYRVVVKKQRYRLFGIDSLVPNWTDVVDIWRNFRWFLYLGPEPKMDRWTYWEKFDYWAVFWGVALIGASGLLLAFPVFFTRFVPGIALSAALVIHSEEAMLAVGFIFIFHFFHNHLRPQKFPIDVSILTGRVPLDRFKEERPLQYERLVSEGKLEQALVPAPSRFMTVISVIFGFSVIITGLTLIGLVIAAG